MFAREFIYVIIRWNPSVDIGYVNQNYFAPVTIE